MIQVHQRVGPDGILKLAVPLGASDANKDVVVTIQTLSTDLKSPQKLGWVDFLDATYGSCADLSMERAPQGDLEARETLD
jgi:hypothetical protein